jgi:methylase of polypeptide subunit release factors
MPDPNFDPHRLVTDAYRLLLGRDADPKGLAHYVGLIEKGEMDIDGLRLSFLASAEFAAHNGPTAALSSFESLLRQPPQEIEHEVDPETLTRLANRVREQWTALGEAEPHWSVLTDEAFRQRRLTDQALKLFYDSGSREADLLETFEARAGTRAARGVCVELGCGVGRITRYLAERFERVLAVDISPGNLALCRSYMDEQGVDNVETVQVSGLEDLADLPDHDLFFSIIVLQHNPPPIQKAMLQSILPKSGAALFQIPASLPHYRFRAAEHLTASQVEMDMHALPQGVVLTEMKRAGLNVLGLSPDHFTCLPGSFTYFGTRS